MAVVSTRDPLEKALRNVKIATFLVVACICLVVADIVFLLARHR